MKVWYMVVTFNDVSIGFSEQASEALEAVADFDKAKPEDAPHRVIQLEESAYKL